LCGTDEIVKEIGTGTFGKVFKCNDRKHNDVVAIKVIRGIKKYVDSAKIEASILDDVYTRQKREGVECCLKLYSHFPLDGILT
jgi:serine/threonine protein kinase